MISSEYYTVTYRNKATGKAVDEVKEVGTYEVVVTFKDLYEGQVVKQIVKQMSSNLSWQFTINIYNKIYSFTILIQEITNYEKRVSAYL